MTSREYLFVPAAQLDTLDDENYAALLSALAAIGAVACSAHRDLHYPRLASFVYFRLDHGGVMGLAEAAFRQYGIYGPVQRKHMQVP